MKPRNSNRWGSSLQVKAGHKSHSMSEGLVRFPTLAEEGQGPLQPGVSPWAAGSHPRGPAENSAVICVAACVHVVQGECTMGGKPQVIGFGTSNTILWLWVFLQESEKQIHFIYM